MCCADLASISDLAQFFLIAIPAQKLELYWWGRVIEAGEGPGATVIAR